VPKFLEKLLSVSRYSLLSLIALLLGFWREIVVSSHFGLSKELDVYVAMLGFYLFFGMQVANTLEMVFISKSAKADSQPYITAQLLRAIKVLVFINLLVASVLHSNASLITNMFFPGFSIEQINLGVDILDKLLLAIIFANFSGLLRASLNMMKVFSPGLLSGAMISFVSACTVILFTKKYGLDALVLGFIGGNCLVFCLLLMVYLTKIGWRGLVDGYHFKSQSAGLWKAALIVFIGEICYQGFSLTERSYASKLPTGTISAFYYAWTLLSVPMAVVVTPLSTIVYPKLAKVFSTDRNLGYRLLLKYMGPLFLFSLVVVSVVTWFSDYLVTLVLMRGNFTIENAKKTAEILAILIFSVPFSSFGRMVRYSLYALGSYSGASVSQLVTLITIFFLAPILMPVYGILGLAYASSVAISLQSIAMFVLLWIQIRYARS
jgi:putative peptidoglycan lipid II flippase